MLHLSLEVVPHVFIKSTPPSPFSSSPLAWPAPFPTSNPQSIALPSPGLVPVWKLLVVTRLPTSGWHGHRGLAESPREWPTLSTGSVWHPSGQLEQEKKLRLSVPQNYIYPQESSEYSSLDLFVIKQLGNAHVLWPVQRLHFHSWLMCYKCEHYIYTQYPGQHLVNLQADATWEVCQSTAWVTCHGWTLTASSCKDTSKFSKWHY